VSNKRLALLHCANYDVGKCSGVLFVRNEDNTQIAQILNKEYEGKACFVEKGCEYFKACVRPAL